MSMIDNWLHFPNQRIGIEIYGMIGIEKALNRIADELEKSNNHKGKHEKDKEAE